MIKSTELQRIYFSKPFQKSSADGLDVTDVLSRYVNHSENVFRSFRIENRFIAGKSGSGKTMHLKAYEAVYQFALLTSLVENQKMTVPIYINFSDLSEVVDVESLYSQVFKEIISGLLRSIHRINDLELNVLLHKSIQHLDLGLLNSSVDFSLIISQLSKRSSSEYTNYYMEKLKTITKDPNSFIQSLKIYQLESEDLVSASSRFTFEDVVLVYTKLLKSFKGRIVLLLDEAELIDQVYCEVMNKALVLKDLFEQLCSVPFITVISTMDYDILKQFNRNNHLFSIIDLNENIKTEEGYAKVLSWIVPFIEKSISKTIGSYCNIEEVIDITSINQYIIEQVIYASDGNPRKCIKLLHTIFELASRRCFSMDRVRLLDVTAAFELNALSRDKYFSKDEMDKVDKIIERCQQKGTYKFKYTNIHTDMYNLINKLIFFKIVTIIESGSKMNSVVYAFDYSYAVYKNIPTHYLKDTLIIDHNRSLESGRRINKAALLKSEILRGADNNKRQGKVYSFIDHQVGIIRDLDQDDYCFLISNEYKNLQVDTKVRFVPFESGEGRFAYDIEIIADSETISLKVN